MSLKDKQARKRKIKSKGLKIFYYEMIKFFSGVGIYLYLRPKIHRASKNAPRNMKGGVLIASNHTSTLDPVALFCVFWRRRLYFPATEELFKKPLNRFFFTNMNCIRIDRGSPNTAAIRRMCELLKDGRAVAIFPEGRINAEEDDIDLKRGTAYMAIKCGCPILPVYVSHRENKRQRVHVVIGEPIYSEDVCKDLPRGERVDALSRYLKNAEAELAGYYEKATGGGAKK